MIMTEVRNKMIESYKLQNVDCRVCTKNYYAAYSISSLVSTLNAKASDN